MVSGMELLRSRWPESARLNGLTAKRPHRLGQCLELSG